MPEIIRCHDNANRAIVAAHPAMDRTYFNRVLLPEGESFEDCLPDHESVWVVISGTVDIHVDGQSFASVGRRRDIWSGTADSVYAPAGARLRIVNTAGPAEIMVAGALSNQRYSAFRITPDEVEMVEVGSHDTHSRRRIFHILGQNGRGRTGNLLVSELYGQVTPFWSIAAITPPSPRRDTAPTFSRSLSARPNTASCSISTRLTPI